MLTVEQIEKKAQELSESLNTKVTAFVFSAGGDQVVGYLKNPSRIVKMRALDKALQSPMEAGESILQCSLIKDESDPRIMSESADSDDIYMGACVAALAKVKPMADEFKKK